MNVAGGGGDDDETSSSLLYNKLKKDPLTMMTIVVVLIGFILYEPINALNTLSGVALMGAIYLGYNKLTSTTTKSSSSSNQQSKSKQKGSSSTSSSLLNAKIKNIWEAGSKSKSKSTNNNSSDDDKKSSTYSDKPFGSKYYYAHNNSSATGGYKDGLKLEDYRMNGPRLLSKNGTPIVETETETDEGSGNDDNDKTSDSISNDTESVQQQQQQQNVTAVDSNVINITKYLWDDPGDYKGIATIRIDSLPESSTSGCNYIDWKDMESQPNNIDARLVGEGLLVKIDFTSSSSSTGGIKKYQLQIKKLYGDANDVSYIVKPKRLLIKITKKKIATLSKNKGNNLDAWPQPYRKI